MERCFILYWIEGSLKKNCVGQEILMQPIPKSVLVPCARFVHSLPAKQLPLCVVGASHSLIRILDESRLDGKRFVVYRQFTEDIFLQCIRQAHQDNFGMLEETCLVEHIIVRLKSALYDDWTEDSVFLRKCISQGSVSFADLRETLTNLEDLWPSIRPYIGYTGLPLTKHQADSVSCFDFDFSLLCLIVRLSPSFF